MKDECAHCNVDLATIEPSDIVIDQEYEKEYCNEDCMIQAYRQAEADYQNDCFDSARGK